MKDEREQLLDRLYELDREKVLKEFGPMKVGTMFFPEFNLTPSKYFLRANGCPIPNDLTDFKDLYEKLKNVFRRDEFNIYLPELHNCWIVANRIDMEKPE